ncbi:hypothetical protein HOK00_04835, partial [bacterium]|nr:hypothetical protein [bacterium]
QADASCQTIESLFQTFIFGTVSDIDLLSNNNASQSILDTAQTALGFISINHLYVDIHHHLDNDLDNIFDEVFFQI